LRNGSGLNVEIKSSLCALCRLDLPKNPLLEKGHAFCCNGCLTVFTLIGTQENYQSHPLFQEAIKAGILSNAHAEPQAQQTDVEQEEVKFHLQIDGMWCPACAEAIQLILLKQKGISRCLVDYATDLAMITIQPRLLSKQIVITLIHKLGYRASELFSEEKRNLSFSLWLRFVIAAFCAMNIMMFSYPLYASHFGQLIEGYGMTFGWFSFALALPLVTYCAWPIWRRLTLSFLSGFFAMETLVLMGVSTAFILSTLHLFQGMENGLYFDSLSMVITFVLLGKILERKAKFSAKETLFRLSTCLPKKACKKTLEGDFIYVPIKEVHVGDSLFVRTGEKVLFDGIVIQGEALVDEAVMTGEAMPCSKQPGAPLIGGSLIKQGNVIMQVTKERSHSLIGQILLLIEQDLAKKNRTSQLIHTITRYFIPCVLALALLACLLFEWERSLTLLLISCPCAMGIAAPLVQSRLYFRFAEKGALVRARNQLHLLGQRPFFVFDKTGTLTEGKFEVLKGLEGLSSEHLRILKALASISQHPISLALSKTLTCPTEALDEGVEIVGRGVCGIYQGKEYILGSERFLKEKGFETTSHTTTVVYLASEKKVLAEIHLGDRLRTHLPKVEGVILSGDSPKLVSNVAHQCGFLWGKGGMDPLQKREEILKLKAMGRPIIMVGDGINDAPAMTAADLGISVATASDMAVEVSDILLTTEHLDALPILCQLAKKSQKIIYQNLFWAFFYNGVGVGLAFFGIMDPFFAALAMITSSLCVSLNALRL